MTEKTPIKNKRMKNNEIKNSFFKYLIELQLMRIQIGINKILRDMKKKEIPSTANIKSPQLSVVDLKDQVK